MKFHGIGGAGRSNDLAIGRIRPAKRYVVPDGCVENEGILKHRGDVVAQGLETQISQIDTVEGDATDGRVVEAPDQVCDSCFACTARSNERDRTRRYKGDPVENLPPRGVGEDGVIGRANL